MTIKQWWNGLEARERRTLGLGALALTIILYVFVIWLPAHERAEAMETRLAQQRELLEWTRQATAEAVALRGSRGNAPVTGTGDQALYSLADQTARQSGLSKALRRVEPTGENQVRVNLESASFDAMVGWIADLRRRYGIEVTLLSVRRAQEAGRVDAQLTLAGGAS